MGLQQTLVIMLSLAANAPTVPDAQLSKEAIGHWRSPDVGEGDFPIWIEDTYNTDGTMQSDYFAKPHGRVEHYKDKTSRGRWRVLAGKLQIDEHRSGTFRPAASREINCDAAGEIKSIEGWKKIAASR